jgi:hypothetical protein
LAEKKVKRIMKKNNSAIVWLLLFFFTASLCFPPFLMAKGRKGGTPTKGGAQKSPPTVPGKVPETIQVTIPAGTPIRVHLNQAVSSSKNKTGDQFSATLKEPLVISGQALVPANTQLEGFISQSVESGRFQGTALLELRLMRLTFPDQTAYTFNTDPIKKTGRSHLLHNIGLIGGGAILGAGLGSLFGQISGAVLGIGLGAAAGAMMAYATGKEELALKAGSEVVFKLSLPVTVSVKPSATAPK